MDPNACLRAIEECLEEVVRASNDDGLVRAAGRQMREHCAALRQWVRSGGFEPDWSKYPCATQQYAAFARRNR